MIAHGKQSGYRRFTLVCRETKNPHSFVHLRHFAPANGIPEDRSRAPPTRQPRSTSTGKACCHPASGCVDRRARTRGRSQGEVTVEVHAKRVASPTFVSEEQRSSLATANSWHLCDRPDQSISVGDPSLDTQAAGAQNRAPVYPDASGRASVMHPGRRLRRYRSRFRPAVSHGRWTTLADPEPARRRRDPGGQARPSGDVRDQRDGR